MLKRYLSLSKPLMMGFRIIICLLIASSVRGAESKLIPRISIRETYNDNIHFSTRKEKHDFISTITPLLRWNCQTEKTWTTANAQLNVIRYSKEDDLDKINQQYNLTHNYRATELFSLNIDASFIKDSTLESGEETNLVFKQSDRDSYNIRPGISLYLTELNSLNLNFRYSKTDYEDPQYTDYDIYDGIMEFVHIISEEGATFSAQGGYTHYEYEISDMDNYSFHLGLTYPFTEKLKLSAWAGARYTESEYEVRELEPVYWPGTQFITGYQSVKKTESDTSWGWLSYLALTRAFAHGSVSLSINRELTPSGYGETIERDRATLSLDCRFTELFTGSFSGSWSRSESESKYRDTDEQSYTLRPSLRWRITAHTVTELSYQYRKIENMNTDAIEDRNTIFLGFTIYWEKLI